MSGSGFGWRAGWLLLLGLLMSRLGVAAEPAKLAVFSGDTESASSIAALHALQKEHALKQVEMRVFAKQELTDADRQYVREANLVIANTHERGTLLAVADEIRAGAAAGHEIYGVGSIFDPDISDLGIRFDRDLDTFFEAGGQKNITQMLRAALSRRLVPGLSYTPAVPVPETAYFEIESGEYFARYDDYVATYTRQHPERRGRPWVGVFFGRSAATSGQTQVLSAIAAALERRGLNVLPAFGYPAERDLVALYLDDAGKSRVQVMIGLVLKLGNVPDKLTPVLTQLDVPILNAITLYSLSRKQWEESPTGIDFAERSWQLGGAELAGAIAPTVVASLERVYDKKTSSTYSVYAAIDDRIERLTDRAARFVTLRQARNSAKRVALIYYNYPPGRGNVGASYLNVLPQSLWQILERLRREGYEAAGAPSDPERLFSTIRDFGSNPTPGSQKEVDTLVASGEAQLLPVAVYRKWFDALPASLRKPMLAKWGEPERSKVMTWRNREGALFFVFPAHRWGNLLFAAQPPRGWDQDIAAAYHDVTLPPHHQYLAFYLWLQRDFQASAMVHVGTHGTMEWLSGKEVGFTSGDPGEVMAGAVPQLYPYIVDNIGEGQQAKRRGMAAVISHLTPPMDKASMNPEMRAIADLMSDYHVAREKGSIALTDILRDITARTVKTGMLTDLSIDLQPGALLTDDQLEEIEHHIKRIAESYAPFGLHTFGVAPSEAARAPTAEAILSLEPKLSAAEHATRKQELMGLIETSARAELDALVAGLDGRFIAPGPGNDPMRAPDALPTGRNFYGFDPARLPTEATFLAGKRLGEEFLASYRKQHGQYPDRIAFNLWATEANRHEGTIEAEILFLMGVRPRWDLRGRVEGVEVISRQELGRPRVDVTIVPSGLYRDLFAQLMLLLDQAVSAVKTAEPVDNPLLTNIAKTKQMLEERGVDPAEAERMASVRLFSEPPGAYGTGLENVVNADKTWNREQDVADVYFRRVGHLFGQGYWGTTPGGESGMLLAQDVFKAALSGAKAVIHSRSSNVYGVLDNDDVYQYLGGTAMAIRQIDGRTPEVMIANLTDPRGGETVTLQRFMGEEMRARYLNPKWIEAMLKEGYAGARLIKDVADNLWGWQVTVPEAVDGAKWQELYETYVEDRYRLNVRERFQASGNVTAYRGMVERMLVAIDKGYWKAAPETVARLRSEQRFAANAVAAELREIERIVRERVPAKTATAMDSSASSASARAESSVSGTGSPSMEKPADRSQSNRKPIKGRAVEEVTPNQPRESLATTLFAFLALGLATLMLMAGGWWRERRREREVFEHDLPARGALSG